MIPAQKSQEKRPRPLDSLTTFRFFAAAAIVAFHTFGRNELFLRSGVSFFYVLSGFVLVYVHPRLPGWVAVFKFWIARWARIWPLHIVTFLFSAALLFIWHLGVPLQKHLGLGIVFQITLLQSWVPISREALSFNGVSWSLSVEAFFYLLFPFLLPLVTRYPGKTLLLALAVRLLLAFLGLAVGLPAQSHGHTPDYETFILFCPLNHLHKFILGMALATWWMARQEVQASWNLLETGSLLAVVVLVPAIDFLMGASIRESDPLFMKEQFADTIYCFLYGALLFVFAYQRGVLSAFFSRPWLVFLGDISFSIYMLHYYVLMWVEKFVPPDSVIAAAVAAPFIILVSALSYFFVERSARYYLNWVGARFLAKVSNGAMHVPHTGRR